MLGAIRVGIVAEFDVAILNDDAEVDKPASPATRDGPFLCVESAGDLSVWVEITTQQNRQRQRFPIERRWRSGGTWPWLNKDQYLNDGATTYRGPAHSFQSAANETGRDRYGGQQRRPQVSPEGVQAVREEIERCGGHRLEPPVSVA
jgi:hypothetical protein